MEISMTKYSRQYRDFWYITWQDVCRRRDRYRNALFMAKCSIYTNLGNTWQEAQQKALQELEELDQSLAQDAARDAEFWENSKH